MSTDTNIYSDIARRTGGDIYIGVVGPVRTGKSTFIKRFMDTLVIPSIDNDSRRERATDELPQSAAGRTIMTTEPKFIPEEAVGITLDDNVNMNVRMIDCVGYIVPSALGYIEGDEPRMVATPWFDQPVPFNMAAELGTRKVINEHSTIGLVITTDGSISEIPREEYEEAEGRVIEELKAIDKPFLVLLNCMYPNCEQSQALAAELSERYGTGVLPINCLELDEQGIRDVLSGVLAQFPVKEIGIDMPRWISALQDGNWLAQSLYGAIKDAAADVKLISHLPEFANRLANADNVASAQVKSIDLGTGRAVVELDVDRELFYRLLGETTGLEIAGEQELMQTLLELAKMRREYSRVKNALDEVEATGYGIVMPESSELSLEEPEIIRQGGRYGVRLRASAPSIHMMKANITTEVSPIVGSEKQSEDLIKYLLSGFEENPAEIWSSNIFGKSLHELVNEGLHAKLAHMPGDARMKMQETIERVINEGCSGLICIIL